jgi:hypothetical protein
MGRRAFLSVLAIVALLVSGLGLWAAAPAFAAPKPIGLSADGVSYADDLPASLFAGAMIVPGKTVTRSFWVKNRAGSAGNLAIALQGVAGADHALVAALSASAVAGPNAGPLVAFSAANPCYPLVSAVALAAGAIVRVDITLDLSPAVPAHASQGSLGAFDLRVTMTSTDVAAPSGCAAVAPPVTGGGGGGGTPPTSPGGLDTITVSGAADGTLPGEGGLPDLSGSGDGVAAAIVQPTSSRFFQEYLVVAWLIALILGCIFAAWRRSRDPREGHA